MNTGRKPDKCFSKWEQKWAQPPENIVARKKSSVVEQLWLVLREGEGPAAFWRRWHSVEPDQHSHVLSRLIHELQFSVPQIESQLTRETRSRVQRVTRENSFS